MSAFHPFGYIKPSVRHSTSAAQHPLDELQSGPPANRPSNAYDGRMGRGDLELRDLTDWKGVEATYFASLARFIDDCDGQRATCA
jgi:hypothetical protein